MATYQVARAVEPSRRVVRAGHGLLDRPPRAARRGADAPLGPRPPRPRPRERRRRRSERHVLGRFEGAAPDRRQQLRAAATRCEVLLRRRSLLAFSREAYTECTHEIGAAPDTIGPRCANLDAAGARVGDVVGRAGERVSFTLRCAGGAE